MRSKINNERALERQTEATTLITSGHVWSAVWYLAWPTAINQLFGVAYNFIDRSFLGHLPNYKASLAAVGIGGNILMLQFAFVIGLTAGAAALVSRFIGANEHKNAEEAARQSLILAVIAAIVTGILTAAFAGPLVKLIGAKPNVAPLATSYTLVITCSSSIQLFLWMMGTTILRSQGDVRSPLFTGGAVVATNILCDWLLIFGFWHIPAMGILGAACATAISRTVGTVLSLWFVRRSVVGGALTRLRLDLSWFSRTFAIGWPAAVQSFAMTGAGFLFLKILWKLPGADQAETAVAAFTVAMCIESLSFMPGLAYSTAATPLVGQNLGAGRPQRARHSAWVAAGQAVLVMGFVATLFLVIPQYLASPFMKRPVDLALLGAIVSYLRINSFSQPFLALNMVFRGALQGAGDTLVPMILTVSSLWIVRLPLAWLFAIHLGWGVTGAWWAMSITCCLSGILMVAWFRAGHWESRQV